MIAASGTVLIIFKDGLSSIPDNNLGTIFKVKVWHFVGQCVCTCRVVTVILIVGIVYD